jgi:hypothetical protein
MVAEKDTIIAEITWFNAQIARLDEMFIQWLKEDGRDVQNSERKITKQEEMSGEYTTSEYELIVDNALKITLVPYGIWIVAAQGRIDIVGPSGSEKLVYLKKGGPATVVEISSGSYPGKNVHRQFNTIDEDGWYWYDDSIIRKATKLGKEVFLYLLGRVQ